nr:hypothetical protein [Porphyromonas gulae]
MARESFRFGSRSKKFSRQNEKNLAPFLQDSRATIGAFSARISYCRKRPFVLLRGRLLTKCEDVTIRSIHHQISIEDILPACNGLECLGKGAVA